jgi:peptidylprolyl isomerase
MAAVKDGDTVKIHYTGKLSDGTVFDSTREREPMQFAVGSDEIIPGVEKAVVGMKPGESKTIKLAAGDAFGPRQDAMVFKLERNKLPDGLTLENGRQLQYTPENGPKRVLTITNVTDKSVTLDGNHPLAGKDLTFDLELVAIA